ncbi:hypothetical protein [Jannaschia rubra]|uniref:Uncharacterized protein n=1 Tax=Jannaschia rubra TaxID=282197 RepID=A0A0M6XTA7_9RHOB|nr:hypothetical protein [Jannaschia rubra]CTQ33451.1 hypothetical protein JAN5088_02233 [Jannaschia rubra]SFG02047.1 hypothetical protein SAMN04488517_102280 [Jannaschia rubra]
MPIIDAVILAACLAGLAGIIRLSVLIFIPDSAAARLLSRTVR